MSIKENKTQFIDNALLQEDFEKWFHAVETGDGDFPPPENQSDPRWDEYAFRHATALGAWLEAWRQASLKFSQPSPEEDEDFFVYSGPQATIEDLKHLNPQHFGIIDPDYARIYTIGRCIAWQEGYSCCAQGSFTRDLDLLLTPWTDAARPDVSVLILRIAQACELTIVSDKSEKPHGRFAWTLKMSRFGDPRFVDISAFEPKPR